MSNPVSSTPSIGASSSVPNTPIPPTKGAAGGAAAGPAVIRRIGGVEETMGERVVHRHLPAWVVSGLVHLGIIFLAWLVFGFNVEETKATTKVLTTTVEKEPEEPVKDLTNEDPGFESTLDAALPDIEKVAEKTVDALVSEDPIGVPDAATMDSVAYQPPGLPSMDNLNPGILGETGSFTAGSGGGQGQFSAGFLGRSGATKSRLLKAGGGNDESERAVAAGLAWLARQQKSNGSWVFDGDPKQKNGLTTSTAMALLPFLAAGQTHKISCKYQKTVNDALQFLTANLNTSTGRFNLGSPQYMYGHGIATMALCEAYGMSKDRRLLPYAQAAVNFLVANQASDGSWGYQPKTPGDTSIVGWELQALKAGQLTKEIVVPDTTIKRALKFLDSVASGSRKAVYGYRGPDGKPGSSLTAVGLLCRYYFDGWGPGSAGMAEGVPGLFGTPKKGAKPGEPQTNRQRAPKTRDQVKKNSAMPDMYYYYYATQVVHFFEGPEWKEWNEGPKDEKGQRIGGMRDWLLLTQNKAEAPLVGSWAPDSGSIGKNCGRIGTTALALLTLEVYYRHLPLYKRDQGGLDILDAVK